jgi:hypothetical protein
MAYDEVSVIRIIVYLSKVSYGVGAGLLEKGDTLSFVSDCATLFEE